MRIFGMNFFLSRNHYGNQSFRLRVFYMETSSLTIYIHFSIMLLITAFFNSTLKKKLSFYIFYNLIDV